MFFPSLKLALPDWVDTHVAMVHGAQAVLTDSANRVMATGHPVDVELLDLSVLHTGAPEALATAAREWHADLVAVAAHPRGHRWACRLDPEEVATATGCPILYVPTVQLATAVPSLDRALVALDGSATSIAALRLALDVLSPRVQLRVVYVVDRSMHPGEQWLRRLFEANGERTLASVAPLLNSRGAAANVAIIATEDELDDIASAILRDASEWRADLVVTGLRGSHDRQHGLPGSVASRALRNTTCPLLVSPPPVDGRPEARTENQAPGSRRNPAPDAASGNALT